MASRQRAAVAETRVRDRDRPRSVLGAAQAGENDARGGAGRQGSNAAAASPAACCRHDERSAVHRGTQHRAGQKVPRKRNMRRRPANGNRDYCLLAYACRFQRRYD